MKRTRRKKQRVYWRSGRAWGDFRDYADVGGGRERLVVEGEKLATTDQDVANLLVAAGVKDLDARLRGRALHGRAEGTPLAAYAADHLVKKAQAGKVTRDWLDVSAVFLKRAVEYFGSDRDLASISTEDVEAWAAF